ncbi:MAG: hypothetical protein GXO32_02135 [Crenarchaeota archaeon]|nr:hypothetical protein [Thermoproteota archaeon]
MSVRKRFSDNELYDLQSARAMLRSANLCLGYAATYLRGTDDELYEELRKARELLEEVLIRIESKLSSYLPEPRTCTKSRSSNEARRIIEEVIFSR